MIQCKWSVHCKCTHRHIRWTVYSSRASCLTPGTWGMQCKCTHKSTVHRQITIWVHPQKYGARALYSVCVLIGVLWRSTINFKANFKCTIQVLTPTHIYTNADSAPLAVPHMRTNCLILALKFTAVLCAPRSHAVTELMCQLHGQFWALYNHTMQYDYCAWHEQNSDWESPHGPSSARIQCIANICIIKSNIVA